MSEQQPGQNLKYRIKQFLLKRYPDDSVRAEAIRALAERLNVSPNHLRKMANYRRGSPNEVKLSQLKIIAESFNVKPEALVISYE